MASCPLKILTLKVAFLVAIASARWVSELAAMSTAKELCSIQEDRVTLSTNPTFLPRVNPSFLKSQQIILPSFCTKPTHPREREWHCLDVKCAITFYLQHTASFRETEVLFVSYREL